MSTDIIDSGKKKAVVPILRFQEFKEDWSKFKINNLTSVVSGGTPSTLNKEFWGGNIPWMNSGELNLKLVYNVKNRITELGLNKSSTKIIPENSILIGLAGQGKTRGTAAMNMIALSINQSIAAILPNQQKFNSSFLYLNIDSRYDELRNLSTGDGGRGGLNLQIIKSFNVTIPSLPEQQKIASFLSAVDEKIQQLSRKKKLLEQYKKGVMQQLFSGKLRFKDENGKDYADWERDSFSKFIKLYRGSSPRPIIKYTTTSKDGVNWIKIGDTKHSNNFRISSVSEKITKEGALKSRFVESGEIILANSMSFGKSYLLEIEGCIYDGWFVLRKYEKSYNKEFLLQLLNSEFLQRQYFRLSTGGVVQNISSDIVYSTLLFRPVVEEQQKIANFLSSIDVKIENTNQEIKQMQNFKKGLLQQMFV